MTPRDATAQTKMVRRIRLIHRTQQRAAKKGAITPLSCKKKRAITPLDATVR
jgi:hypothetical protein